MHKPVGIYHIVLHSLLIVLAVTVVVLVRENREIRSSASTPELIAEGALIPPFRARELDGGSRWVDPSESERDTLLFVFTTVCPACRENQAHWTSLHERLKDHYDVLGVSLNELEVTQRYREHFNLPFPVVVPEDIRGFATENKLLRVPLTVHVGKDREVLETWVGILSEDSLEELAMAELAVARG